MGAKQPIFDVVPQLAQPGAVHSTASKVQLGFVEEQVHSEQLRVSE